MLKIDLVALPPSRDQIAAERLALQRKERSRLTLFAAAVVLVLALGWEAFAPMPTHQGLAVFGIVSAGLVACVLWGSVMQVAGELADLTPANPVQLVQLPTLAKHARVAGYLALVDASGRPLTGLEFLELSREASRARMPMLEGLPA